MATGQRGNLVQAANNNIYGTTFWAAAMIVV